tara:strand:+ start:363 stop:590 length:228 start_codon:yes stop_codon:yes gene_type:complete
LEKYSYFLSQFYKDVIIPKMTIHNINSGYKIKDLILVYLTKTQKTKNTSNYFGFEIAICVTSQFPYSNAEAQEVR